MQPARLTVAIVGAGIGGLTAALAFARNGAEVFVFEQAPALTEVGAGIQITPNAGRVLQALGLADAVAAAGLVADAVVPCDGLRGQAITRFDLTRQSPRYRFFHRTDLLAVLADAARAAGADIRLGVAVRGASDGVLETAAGPVQADVIVGADGIHSVMRHICQPDAPPAQFTGQVAWRATVPMAGVAPQAQIWMAPGRHVVSYPLARDVLNIVAVQERDSWAAEGWHHADDPANLRAAFADCAPALRDMLGQVHQTRLWGLYRHDIASVWARGAVALLGDAAHPTLPFLAQGANLAIEDAYVLARCVASHDRVGAAFRRYQQLRKSRVARAIAVANGNARNYHLSGIKRRVAFAGLKGLGAVAPDAFLNRLGWLYDFDVTA